MTGPQPPVSWYLGRDGQQFGPLTDVELRKLAEMRHLRPGDLVWRDGMKEWRPALTMFPPAQPSSPPPPPQPQQQHAPHPHQPAPLQQQLRPQSPPNVAPFSPRPLVTAPPPPPRQPPDAPNQGHFVRAEPPPRAAGIGDLRMDPRAAPASMAQPHSQPHPQPHPMSAPKRQAPPPEPVDDAFDDTRDDEDEAPPRRSRVKRAAILLFFLSTLSAAAWYAYPHRAQIMNFVVKLAPTGPGPKSSSDTAPSSTAVKTQDVALNSTPAAPAPAPTVAAPAPPATTTAPKPHDTAALAVSPLTAAGATPDAADATFQRAALWRVLKREFPEWYALQLKQAVELEQQKKDPAQVASQMAQSLAALRRQYASQALQASPNRLVAIAQAFVENLAHLKKHSTEACYGYIAQGETNPVIVTLMRSPEHTPHLQGHAATIFEAIAEGRKAPRAHIPPKQSDFDALVAELTSRGWSQADLQLFSDDKALARSPQDKVCKMVHQWFEAQLALKDHEARQRLLADTLRPIVQG